MFLSQPSDATVPPSSTRLGVGIIGAGPVTQAIHLPTLSRLPDQFEVVKIMDVDARTAETVSKRVGAAFTTDYEDLLADSRVDVVAICSPAPFHAAQVIAACRAGVKAVLCEKPFAVNADQAAEIVAVATETGVPIVVGAMHAFDPGWLAAVANWGDLRETAHTIRSTIVLPPNPRFEDFATEVANRPQPSAAGADAKESASDALRESILGLAIHDLPLIREFLPHFSDLSISRAQTVEPAGYAISGVAAGRIIDLRSAHIDSWRPQWLLEVFGQNTSLKLMFTPSYVQAGSAVAELRTATETRVFGPYSSNGYEGEWQHLHRLATGGARPNSTERLIDDLRFALEIADKSADLALTEEMA